MLDSRKFLVLLPMGPGHPNTRSEWQATELFGFGMTLVNRYQENRHAYHLYKYDIATYKKVPEWLNVSRWANPELWNKYRW
ncbi:MAG: hypothetical protein GY771_11905 [bacterium]|nr:hypothetical protein [bacterium]